MDYRLKAPNKGGAPAATDSTPDTPDTGRWLLLHGWLDTAASFDLLVPELFRQAAAGAGVGVRQVVALDMMGHGRSGHRRGPYHGAGSPFGLLGRGRR